MSRLTVLLFATFVFTFCFIKLTKQNVKTLTVNVLSNDQLLVKVVQRANEPRHPHVPQRRPIRPLRPHRPRPPVYVPSRPANHVPQLEAHPRLLTLQQIEVPYHHHQHPNITAAGCVNTTSNISISSFCQGRAAAKFSPQSLSKTWETCCFFYTEAECIEREASNFCKNTEDATLLISYTHTVVAFFSDTLCRVVPRENSTVSCDPTRHQEEVQEFEKEAPQLPLHRLHFIEVPKAIESADRTCFDTLRNHSAGNWKSTCLVASLNIWDSQRRRLKDSFIWETCCSMYDAINCITKYAKQFCSPSEANEVQHYKEMSEIAFTQGVCRAVPDENKTNICRGRGRTVKPSFVLSLFTILLAFLAKNALFR